MRDGIRIKPAFLAADGAPAGLRQRRGDMAATARALQAWGARHPNPYAPRSLQKSKSFSK